MPIARRYRSLGRCLALAWLRTDDGERLPADVLPAYASNLHALILRFVLGGPEQNVPSLREFKDALEDLRFILVSADPDRTSGIYGRAAGHLLDAEQEAGRVPEIKPGRRAAG